MGNEIDKAVSALAHRQRGYVTRRQLLDLGVGAEGIKYRIRVGRLIPVYSGVYAVGHKPTLPPDRAYGALLACGPTAVLSHGSAAALWGLRKGWRLPFEVTASSARRRPGIRIHRSTTLTRGDIRTHLGLRVTSPARTLLDIAPRLTEKPLRRAVNELRLSRQLRVPDLAELLDRCPRHPGAKRLRQFVGARTGPTRSEFEDAFLEFTDRFGLPRPLVNVKVHGREVDALFPVERVIVELDGYDFHSSRESFDDDRERDAEMLAHGLQTVRITWDRLKNTPAREAARLEAILEARRG